MGSSSGKALVQPQAGMFPAFLYRALFRKAPLTSHDLSIFIDESGDFGPFEAYAPFCIISLVFHNQVVRRWLVLPNSVLDHR